MIRYTALWLFVFGLIWYAWKRDWVRSLCALVAMLAVLERPDMPKEIFGINGLNPFNLGFLGICGGWLAARRRETNTWDVPPIMTALLVLYLLVTTVSTARLLLDPSYLVIYQRPDFLVSSMRELITDYGVNTFKWLLPALLLIQGCRGEERSRWVVMGVLAMYAVLAILVIKQMPLGYLLDGEALQQRAANILQRRVGYHRVDLATMFSGAAWAMLAARPLFSDRRIQLGLAGLFGITTIALALTGGRTGYATWCVVGLAMSMLKWRKYLLLAPVALAVVLVAAPGISQRMLQGIQGSNTDKHLITSGRNVIWPFVIDKIRERPIAGFGRQAWVRTNLRLQAALNTGENFGHPHNAYLEFALDNGLIGISVLLPLLLYVLWTAQRLFRDPDPLRSAAGGLAFAMTFSYAIAAFGAQTFYPREGTVGMWCFIALAIRVARDTSRATASAAVPAKASMGSFRPSARPGWRQPSTGAAGQVPRPRPAGLRPGARVRQWPR
ncbi:MAG TPA: O-antigen ligase family protein [Vicinamibacterales bacterium]|nr:O-antigen ligase family protein [Vicinamibacterales bacterium]